KTFDEVATMSRSRLLLIVLAAAAACSRSTNVAQNASPAAAPAARAAASNADARVGLKAGEPDAGEAVWNARLVSAASKAKSGEGFNSATNSDLAFAGKYAVQGNYHGFLIYDVSSTPPALVSSYVCPASQNDVSVYKQQLLFMSAEAPSARLDCGTQGVRDSVSAERVRGIRIFDITDIAHPRYITSVQTCRGSHTHSVLVSPNDKDNIYIYVSGSSGVRPTGEMAECLQGTTDENPNTALFRVEVIKVPLAHPEQSAIVGRARLF